VRAATIVDFNRGPAGNGWIERLELVETRGCLQLCVSQKFAPGLGSAETWASTYCYRWGDLEQAALAWIERRRAPPAAVGEVLRVCEETLAAWKYSLPDRERAPLEQRA
jgi:hypothetical protein